MPTTRVEYVPLPAVIPRRVPDTRTLGDLLRRQGENALQYELAKGQSAAQMWQQLGKLFSSYGQGRREDQANALALQQRKDELAKADQLRRDEFNERKAERDEAARVRRDLETRRQTEEAAKVGDAVAESIGYGPMNEPQMEQVLQSPAQAARARYSFGPGTAEGPELLPTRDQQEEIDWRKQVEAKGGMVGPKGQAVMPPKPTPPPNPTEASLAVMAANGDRGAIRALEILRKQNASQAQKEPEKPSVWISKGSDMRYVTPTDASRLSMEGWRSGQSREQGRPVTSGDAKDLADVNEALKLAGRLNFKPSDTGIMPSIGASSPDWFTNLTGFGVGDKQRQGIINLVKQIIGKGLEGGVLRKEDESKYEKMLPTMSDHPDVVKTKVANMITTLEQKRDVRLNSLEDANYDVSKYRERALEPLTNRPKVTRDANGNLVAVPKGKS